MHIRWTIPALRDFTSQVASIAEDNSDAAERMRVVLLAATWQLVDYPYRGRPGRKEGTRELVIAEFPTYLVVYRVIPTDIRIIRVWHASPHR